MSQPHDGHRTFLPFGNPFRMIFPKGSHRSPKLFALLSLFEQTLAGSLKTLKPNEISDIWSLCWLSHAMSFLSETHNSIKTLITDLELPVSDWDEKWIDIYLESSVKLLDICIAISSELSRLAQGQILLQYALHSLDMPNNNHSTEQLKRVQTTLFDWMQQISFRSPKLEDCCAILQGLASSLYKSKVKNSAKGKALMRALYGVQAVTVFICCVLTSALSGCSKPFIPLVVPDKFLWAEAFNDLQTEVLKEITSQVSAEKVIMSKELEAVEMCVKRLCAFRNCVDQKDKVISQEMNGACNNEIDEDKDRQQEYVCELTKSAESLSLGLDHLSKQVEDFFQIVLKGRDALLCNLGNSDDVAMRESNNLDGTL